MCGEGGSSNSWNAKTVTGSHSSQRKNPESVSIVARAIWQASQTLHRVIITKSGHGCFKWATPSFRVHGLELHGN
jgi:hypothetical protein